MEIYTIKGVFFYEFYNIKRVNAFEMKF